MRRKRNGYVGRNYSLQPLSSWSMAMEAVTWEHQHEMEWKCAIMYIVCVWWYFYATIFFCNHVNSVEKKPPYFMLNFIRMYNPNYTVLQCIFTFTQMWYCLFVWSMPEIHSIRSSNIKQARTKKKPERTWNDQKSTKVVTRFVEYENKMCEKEWNETCNSLMLSNVCFIHQNENHFQCIWNKFIHGIPFIQIEFSEVRDAIIELAQVHY